jgi:flagellar motor switch protein FliG
MSEKQIALTMYGKGDQIIDISVTVFDPGEYHYMDKDNAESYCENINRLKLQDDEWIDARVIRENKRIPLKKADIQFDLIKKLSRHVIMRMLNDSSCGSSVLAIALQGGAIKDTVLNLTLNNPILKKKCYGNEAVFFYEYERLENAGTLNETEILSARKKVVEVIKQLIITGEIVIGE